MHQVKAEVILNYLAENNLTKKAFCEKALISKSTFQKVLRGSNKASVKTLYLIARAMGVSMIELIQKEKTDGQQ